MRQSVTQGLSAGRTVSAFVAFFPFLTMTQPRPIRFMHRGQPVQVQSASPTRTVLQWLREDARATGTKEGCAEGDCGACTVLVAELDETPGAPNPTRAIRSHGLRVRPVNACIRFLPTLDGKALLTVEDLAPDAHAPLHPAQAALIAHHGAQCGFCTPGFVMTLAAIHERHALEGAATPAPSRAALGDALAGNLCRCTGYRPILDAAQAMLTDATPRLPLAGVREQLLAWRAQAQAQAPAPLGHADYHAPRSLAELAALRLALPEARLLAGGTDVGLWVTKQLRPLGPLIGLGDVPELRHLGLNATGDALEIGAGVTLEDAWAALVSHWPALADMARRFAGPPVRHAGTLVGNLANGSPIGDAAPVLMALGATLHLRRGEQQRTLALADFYRGYMQNALQAGEFVQSVSVPLETARAPGWHVAAFKISKRQDCDISAVSAGLAVWVDGGTVREARLAFGGMAAMVRRAAAAEAALVGQPWGEASALRAAAALPHDFTPMTDLRASQPYRLRVAGALLHKLWLVSQPEGQAPLATLATIRPT